MESQCRRELRRLRERGRPATAGGPLGRAPVGSATWSRPGAAGRARLCSTASAASSSGLAALVCILAVSRRGLMWSLARCNKPLNPRCALVGGACGPAESCAVCQQAVDHRFRRGTLVPGQSRGVLPERYALKPIHLCSRWQVTGKPPQAGSPADIVPPGEEADWFAIDVPGDVNAALVAGGRMPDPHFDTQGRGCYWVTGQDWWYRLAFDAPGRPNRRICILRVSTGRLTYGSTASTWAGRPMPSVPTASTSAGGSARSGNCLLLRFVSIDSLLGGPRLDELKGWHERRTFLRKPQFNFGWDWALPLPSIGLSGPVWLEVDSPCRLVDLAVQTFVSGRVDFSFEVSKAARQAGYQIAVRVTGHGAHLARTARARCLQVLCLLDDPRPAVVVAERDGASQSLRLLRRPARRRPGGRQPHRPAGPARIADSRASLARAARPRLLLRDRDQWPARLLQGRQLDPAGAVAGDWRPTSSTASTWPGRKRRTSTCSASGAAASTSARSSTTCATNWASWSGRTSCSPRPATRCRFSATRSSLKRTTRSAACAAARPSCCGAAATKTSTPGRIPTIAQTTGQSDAMDAGQADSWAVDRLKEDPQLYSMILRGTVGLLGLGVPYVESSPASRDDCGNRPNSGNCHISAWKYALFQTNGQYRTVSGAL